MGLSIPCCAWLPIDFNRSVCKIHDPDLSNPRLGVQRELDLAIEFKGGVRDFNEQQDITGFWMFLSIEIRFGSQNGNVGLWLGMLIEEDGILYPHNRFLAKALIENFGETVYDRRVSASDRRHFNNFSIQQLHTVIFREDARFAHLVKLLDSEAMS